MGKTCSHAAFVDVGALGSHQVATVVVGYDLVAVADQHPHDRRQLSAGLAVTTRRTALAFFTHLTKTP